MSEFVEKPQAGNSGRLSRTCTVIVNYQTPDLLENAVRSFKEFYPEVQTIVVDNGSQDESREVIQQLCSEYSALTAELRADNAGHGPAMHDVIARNEYDFYFFLDSDTVTNKGSFLEEMLTSFEDESVYGVGKVVPFNRRGFQDEAEGVPMLIAAYMLIRSSIYQQLPPFEHHGAPVAHNFYQAFNRSYRMEDYPIEKYIDHLHRGTVSRFGYGLGLKGKINYLLNKLGL
ncbi:MAG: glycosyltransferase [Ignavibacteriae bacterium]|nr:glycosyltransferase [Ignavibacteriota bacterium]MCB9217214.1 glycosyltransferase [Ignavibacteria bacterium]